MWSPETIKLNLRVATKGLQMMGLRNALMLNDELSALVVEHEGVAISLFLLPLVKIIKNFRSRASDAAA